MKKLRVVFDTNIFISAIIFGGNPRQCLELARNGEIQLFSSRLILVEFAQKLRQKFFFEEQDIRDAIQGILLFTTLVSPTKKITIVKKDPTDNKILECAEEAEADFLLSGDKKHLLPLKKFHKMVGSRLGNINKTGLFQ